MTSLIHSFTFESVAFDCLEGIILCCATRSVTVDIIPFDTAFEVPIGEPVEVLICLIQFLLWGCVIADAQGFLTDSWARTILGAASVRLKE